MEKHPYLDLIDRAEDYAREERQRQLSDSQPLPLGAKLRYMAAAILVSLGLWALIAWGFVAIWRLFR